jgi:hypothetical protein
VLASTSIAEKIDEADMQRNGAKIRSVEKKAKPRRPGQGLVELAVPTIRQPGVMPDPLVLDKATYAQRQAFRVGSGRVGSGFGRASATRRSLDLVEGGCNPPISRAGKTGCGRVSPALL